MRVLLKAQHPLLSRIYALETSANATQPQDMISARQMQLTRLSLKQLYEPPLDKLQSNHSNPQAIPTQVWGRHIHIHARMTGGFQKVPGA